jgi:hypothetical protein
MCEVPNVFRKLKKEISFRHYKANFDKCPFFNNNLYYLAAMSMYEYLITAK